MQKILNIPLPHSTSYGWLMLAGIFLSIFFWSRVARRDERLVMIYISALVGAFLGAKIAYLAAEGWLHWHDADRWEILATGKSITGALLGGYLSVEIAKHYLKYTGTTGDWFAVIVPVGIMIGRIGCMLNGCCLGRECQAGWFTVNDSWGISRWPSPEVEFLFNALMLLVILFLRGWTIKPLATVNNLQSSAYRLRGQHFHIYLIAYGVFRFFHEFLRDTPKIFGPISGYQIFALALVALGGLGFFRRERQYCLQR